MLLALASTARAQQPVPAAAPAAAPGAAASVAASPAPERRLQLGLSFLPMARGKFDATAGGITETVDAAFAYGVGLSVGYEVVSGVIVGLAPQLTFNGKPKDSTVTGGKQWDLMARIAYEYKIPNVVTLFAEVLPGYSIFYVPGSSGSKGLIVAAGVGAAVDVSEQVFVQFGAGYQKGFQSQTANADYHTSYVRVAIGGGVRF